MCSLLNKRCKRNSLLLVIVFLYFHVFGLFQSLVMVHTVLEKVPGFKSLGVLSNVHFKIKAAHALRVIS